MSKLAAAAELEAMREMENAMFNFYQLAEVLLPSALTLKLLCTSTVEKMVDYAILCEHACKTIPRPVLDYQLYRWRSAFSRLSASRFPWNVPFFERALENLLVSFIQNVSVSEDKSNGLAVTTAFLNKIGPEKLGLLCKKGLLLFDVYEQLMGFSTTLCPSSTSSIVRAAQLNDHIKHESSEVQNRKIKDILALPGQIELVVHLLSQAKHCSYKAVLIDCIDKTIMGDEDHIDFEKGAQLFCRTENERQMRCLLFATLMPDHCVPEVPYTLLGLIMKFFNLCGRHAVYEESSEGSKWTMKNITGVDYDTLKSTVLYYEAKLPGTNAKLKWRLTTLPVVYNRLFWDDLLSLP